MHCDEYVFHIRTGFGLRNSKKKSRIREQSISRPKRIVAPMPQEGGPRIPQNPIFLKSGKNHPKRKNSKTSRNMPKLAIHPSTTGLSSIGKRGCRVDQEYPKTVFFEKRKKSFKTQKLKNVQRYAKISVKPFDQRSLIHREAWFPPCFVRQNQQKKKTFF